jgi:hypothetical protein
MPITYFIDEGDEIIVEVWLGEISIDTLVAYWRAYLRDERVLKIRKTLVDIGQAQIGFSEEQLMQAIHAVVAPVLNGRDWITAIVVKRPRQFWAGRRYQALAQAYSYDSIFSSISMAREWLRKQELRSP